MARGGGPGVNGGESEYIFFYYINVVWRAEGQWSHCGWAPEPAIIFKIRGVGFVDVWSALLGCDVFSTKIHLCFYFALQ